VGGTSTDTETFGRYAAYYDILYQDKDYSGESRFISELIRKFKQGDKKSIRILDLGCGTGGHSIELAGMGYRVEGADISEEMLEIAREKTKEKNLDITYFNESFQSSDNIGGEYDVILIMFAGINYLTRYEDLASALKNIESLLSDDGIFIFDFWNGNAVIDSFSAEREKRITWNNKEIIRRSETNIDRIAQTSTINFHFDILEDGVLKEKFEERHIVRYFFFQEMIDLLKTKRLEVIYRCPFMKISSEVEFSDWNITFVAQKTNDLRGQGI